jgi:hypothetical protein
MMSAMRTAIRLVPASLVAGMVIALSLGGCSRDAVRSAGPVACVLGGVDGELVRQGDGAVLVNARWNGHQWDRLGLHLPEGWTVRSVGSEVELVDSTGATVARTGTHASINAVAAAAIEPLVSDGVLSVCPT